MPVHWQAGAVVSQRLAALAAEPQEVPEKVALKQSGQAGTKRCVNAKLDSTNRVPPTPTKNDTSIRYHSQGRCDLGRLAEVATRTNVLTLEVVRCAH